jgi:hypothetical protein
MDERALKLEARLLAIEYMIAHLDKVLTQAIGATPEMAVTARTAFLQRLSEVAFARVHPAQSDLMAGELQEAFERLFEMMREVAAPGQG